MNWKEYTGLFFGSFNPIHVGHMVLANYFAEFVGLNELWFVVSPHNPLKERVSLLADHHRIEMVNLAIADDPRFRASDIEFHLPKPSYTIHTLTYLEEKYPGRKFALIVGGDNLESFNKWKNPEVILERFPLLVYARPGFDGGEFLKHPSVRIFEAPLMEISSSMIRMAIRQGKNMRFFLPPGVWKYMEEMNLYK
ncbi:MAG: nicotinate (nicotinamide) nucleotide adenylyltransferase [Bacteroidales bacterium]|nr:nicotinate (nicotinamide) nucleotide adenylyltransferase [Bacteroidales bacterium]